MIGTAKILPEKMGDPFVQLFLLASSTPWSIQQFDLDSPLCTLTPARAIQPFDRDHLPLDPIDKERPVFLNKRIVRTA